MLSGDEQLRIGNMTVTLYAPPNGEHAEHARKRIDAGLARLMDGKMPRRAPTRPPALHAAISDQAAEYRRALETGLWAPAPATDLTLRGRDAIVAAAASPAGAPATTTTTNTRRTHHMTTTAAKPAAKRSRKAKATTPAKATAKATTNGKPDVKAMSPSEREAYAAEHLSGLGGKALAHFIATGETAREQAAAAKAQREATAKAESKARRSAAAKAAGTRPPQRARDGITAMQAAEKVLRRARGPMKVSELARKAVALDDFRPTSKTPEASVAARVHVSAKLADGTFIRISRGVVDLRELNPQGAETRPAKRK
jgi:hypothetical protein